MRKPVNVQALGAYIETLQWGRNFIVAETRRLFFWLRQPVLASMGPQLYRCGNTVLAIGAISEAPLQWGRNFIVAETMQFDQKQRVHDPASMGPQLYRCGNDSCSNNREFRRFVLQWGRNFIVAEMGRVYRFPSVRQMMLQWGRNFIVAEIFHPLLTYGNAIWLQWGRNFIVAEMMRHQGRTVPLPEASMGPQLYRCGNL